MLRFIGWLAYLWWKWWIKPPLAWCWRYLMPALAAYQDHDAEENEVARAFRLHKEAQIKAMEGVREAREALRVAQRQRYS